MRLSELAKQVKSDGDYVKSIDKRIIETNEKIIDLNNEIKEMTSLLHELDYQRGLAMRKVLSGMNDILDKIDPE